MANLAATRSLAGIVHPSLMGWGIGLALGGVVSLVAGWWILNRVASPLRSGAVLGASIVLGIVGLLAGLPLIVLGRSLIGASLSTAWGV